MRNYVFALFCMLVAGCEADKPLINNNDNPSNCDTDGVTYSGFVKSVLTQSCYSCHNVANNYALGAGINLESYTNLIAYINDAPNGGSFMGAITHNSNYVAMPQGTSQLDDCTIQKLQKWVSDGAPNN
jgi:hypothetical protein